MTIDFILRLLVAAILGGAIGLEREYRAKEAGIRTHVLVALGSALFMILSLHGVDSVLATTVKTSFDPSRIASQVVTGIGFIGAGTIIFQKHVVRGLTTAAGLWVTAAIGLTCGAGLYLLSLAATLMVLICLEMLNILIRKIGTRSIELTVSSQSEEALSDMLKMLEDKDAVVDSYSMKDLSQPGKKLYQVSMEVKMKRKEYHDNLLKFMRNLQDITVVSIE